MNIDTSVRVFRVLGWALVLAWSLACATGVEAAEGLSSHRAGQLWVGVLAGIALCALVRVIFRWLAYGWFTLWFTGMRLLQYGAIAGALIAFFYFR